MTSLSPKHLFRFAIPSPRPLSKLLPIAIRKPTPAELFVLAVWLGMSFVACSFVSRYGGKLPLNDDYHTIAAQLDHGVPSWEYLWGLHNEHRIPLPKITSWLVSTVTGYKLRPMMFVDVAFFIAAAGVLLSAARKLRSQTHIVDATIPLVILSIGQWENFLWVFQVGFILPVAMELVLIALIATSSSKITIRRAMAIGTLATLLPLCGIPGVVLAIPIALWLALTGIEAWFARRDRRVAMTAILSALIVLTLIAIYFIGYAKPAHNPKPVYNLAAVKYATTVFGGAWGPIVEWFGPEPTSSIPSYLGIATLGLLTATVIPVFRGLFNSESRIVALGMLAFLAGELMLFAGIGTARVPFGTDVPNRYTTLAVPVLVWAFFAWLRFGSPRFRDGMMMAMLLLAITFAWPNADRGAQRGQSNTIVQNAALSDIHFGVPPSFLTEHHSWWLYADQPAFVEMNFNLLRERHAPYFQELVLEPSLTELPAGIHLTGYSPALSPDGWIRADRMNSITVRLAVPPVPGGRAIRIGYSLSTANNLPMHSEMHWMLNGKMDRTVHRFVYKPLKVGTNLEKKLWLGEGVTEVTFVISGPEVAVKFEKLTVLKLSNPETPH